MKHLLWIFILMALVVTACATPQPPTAAPTEGAPIYKVTKSTFLYDAADIDADYIVDLAVGTLLKPANNGKFYDCENLVEDGINYNLCYVEVINTGQTGWILQKWTERQ